MQTAEMIESHPATDAKPALTQCINACFECVQCCTTCADACLMEEQTASLRRCIRTDLDCAAICNALGHVLSRQDDGQNAMVQSQLRACETACRVCAEICEEHASKHEHCRICAECCRRCEKSCQALLSA